MLKSFTLEIPAHTYFGEVYSKEFSLPNNVNKITDVCAVSYDVEIAVSDLPTSAFPTKSGFISLSINDKEIITMPVLAYNNLKNKTLHGNFIPLDTAVEITPNSVFRLCLDEREFSMNGSTGYKVTTFILYQ